MGGVENRLVIKNECGVLTQSVVKSLNCLPRLFKAAATPPPLRKLRGTLCQRLCLN